MKAVAIEFTTNMFGTLPDYIKSSLYNYLEFPTQDHWSEIHSTVISNTGKMQTVWQAVVAVDIRYGASPITDCNDNVLWPNLPTPEVLIKAINNVVFSNLNLN